jgi:hypothetical protein
MITAFKYDLQWTWDDHEGFNIPASFDIMHSWRLT